MSDKEVLAEARSHLRYWQTVLGLDPWEIQLNVSYALSSPDAEAEVGVQWEQEFACVNILAPEVYRALRLPQVQDVEHAVVHELLHILLWPLNPAEGDELRHQIFEQIINRLARALVYARYDKPPA